LKNLGKKWLWCSVSKLHRIAVKPHAQLLVHQRLKTIWPLDLAVIDEAHLVTAPRGASAERRSLAEAARRLAAGTRSLLLLSATPVRDHEEESLQLLHLLAPEEFDRNDLAGFQSRITSRRDIGRELLALERARRSPFIVSAAHLAYHNVAANPYQLGPGPAAG